MAAIVYLATNRVNGKRYVGMTGGTLARRKWQHERDAIRKKSACPRFHNAMRKHGAENFDWAVLLECETFELALASERRLIAELKPEYNLTAGGWGSRGRPWTAAQRAAHSERRKGIEFSEEHRRNLSRAQIGKKQSAETVAKRLEQQRGKPLSAERRQKISASLKGRPRPPHIQAMLAANARARALKRWGKA